ncbi:MAG TPA: transcription-repair coupling factor [Nevskiaceae bacterium]
MTGPRAALALAELAQQTQRLVVAVVANEQRAYRLAAELGFFLGGALPVTHFPDSETLPYDPFSPHQEILSQRLAALYDLARATRGIFVLSAASLLERMPPPAWLNGRALRVGAGEKLDLSAFRAQLVEAGYQSVSEVQAQGEFAVRGALLDLYPMGSAAAYRLDLFDEEIESIRCFDPETQRSVEKVEAVRLLPGREFPTDREGIDTFRRRWREAFSGDPARSPIYTEVSKGFMPAGIESWAPLFHAEGAMATLMDYLPQAPLIVELGDTAAALQAEWRQITERFERYSGNLERPLLPPAVLFHTPEQAGERLAPCARIRFDDGDAPPEARLPAGTTASAESLKAHAPPRVLFVAESAGRRQAMLEWLKPQGILPRDYQSWPSFAADHKRYGIALGPLQESFALPAAGVAVVTEAQVFGQSAPVAARRHHARVRDPATILRDLNDLQPGAPVVHVEHGVGRYLGLQKLSAGGVETEYLVLEYADKDKLYVPVASLNQIHRYTGASPESAPLHSLGNERWAKARARAREKTADVAAELLQVQARRQAHAGHAMRVDPTDYARFCAGFPFETTPDQQSAIDAVLADLAADAPMDRVVCGDVGFGKTEVALRAAFVAAAAGRQVCVLAPTTLLASQHEKNFRDRFSDWPFTIGTLSRLNRSDRQREVLDGLASRKVDIVIGTHRLLQEDVRFADLGLLIVDEEQRFGVRQKERIKNLRAEVDLLTLTATPIPRTLNMSLAGVRELSIVATPPPDRLSIRTFVSEWNSALVQEACLRELKRGGQIYFLHNDVRSMPRCAEDIAKLVPEASVRMAHGQMRERELEQVMLDFYHGRFNLLVCSTIIESGIDVPAANTILIDRADRFGLAQLHQLRGRVGRANRRAYAYLFVPSKRALTPDAQRRLEAITQLDELGAGFALATQDMEIRGAGELLGENQSGQIEEVGFTLYAEMLEAAVRAIRSGKLDDAPFTLTGRGCEVDLGMSALIPEDYVPDTHTRLVLYKRLAETRDQPALRELRIEAIDRFGLLPPQAERLFECALLRQRGEALGITRIRASGDGATFEFSGDARIEPARLIALIQKQPKVYRLEGSARLHVRSALGEGGERAERLLETLYALAPAAAGTKAQIPGHPAPAREPQTVTPA